MDAAWIAVIGTLGGVIVTATSAIAVAWLTTRSQRLTLERQRDHALAEYRRAERRETFIDYHAAFSELREKILALHEQPLPRTARLAEQFHRRLDARRRVVASMAACGRCDRSDPAHATLRKSLVESRVCAVVQAALTNTTGTAVVMCVSFVRYGEETGTLRCGANISPRRRHVWGGRQPGNWFATIDLSPPNELGWK